MKFAQEKYLRFENSSSDKSIGYQEHTKNRGLKGFKVAVSSVVGSIRRGLEQSSRGIGGVRISPNVRLLTDDSKDKSACQLRNQVGFCSAREVQKDAVKCDYEEGDFIGGLECGHEYHVECVKKWLKQHNSCPICKAAAVSPN